MQGCVTDTLLSVIRFPWIVEHLLGSRLLEGVLVTAFWLGSRLLHGVLVTAFWTECDPQLLYGLCQVMSFG